MRILLVFKGSRTVECVAVWVISEIGGCIRADHMLLVIKGRFLPSMGVVVGDMFIGQPDGPGTGWSSLIERKQNNGSNGKCSSSK